MSKPDIEAFIEQANLHHPTIEFTNETFDTETAFLDTVVYQGTRFKDRFFLNLVPLYTTVSKNAVSVSNVSAVNSIVG